MGLNHRYCNTLFCCLTKTEAAHNSICTFRKWNIHIPWEQETYYPEIMSLSKMLKTISITKTRISFNFVIILWLSIYRRHRNSTLRRSLCSGKFICVGITSWCCMYTGCHSLLEETLMFANTKCQPASCNQSVSLLLIIIK